MNKQRGGVEVMILLVMTVLAGIFFIIDWSNQSTSCGNKGMSYSIVSGACMTAEGALHDSVVRPRDYADAPSDNTDSAKALILCDGAYAGVMTTPNKQTFTCSDGREIVIPTR